MKKIFTLIFTITATINLFAQTFKDEQLLVTNYSIEIDKIFVDAVAERNMDDVKLKNFSLKSALKNSLVYEKYVGYNGKETKF